MRPGMKPPSPARSISPASILANNPSKAPLAASSAAAREPAASARSSRRAAASIFGTSAPSVAIVTAYMIPFSGPTPYTDHLTRPPGELGAHPGPDLRALGGLQPYPEDVFDAVHVHAHGDVSGLVPHVG